MLDAEDWKANLRNGLNDIMDQAVRAGARSDQVFDAITEAVLVMREQWFHDPDPADDPEADFVAEPANDWPAAIDDFGKEE